MELFSYGSGYPENYFKKELDTFVEFLKLYLLLYSDKINICSWGQDIGFTKGYRKSELRSAPQTRARNAIANFKSQIACTHQVLQC
jgi:hypothetical protein